MREEILRRTRRLWEISPKFKPWFVELDSGTIVVGFTTKAGRLKRLIGLAYITEKRELLEELYVIYPEGTDTPLRFARIASQGDEHLFLTSPSVVLEEETVEGMVSEIISQIRDMDRDEPLGSDIVRLQAGWLEITEGHLNFGKLGEVELDILDPLKWTEARMQFLGQEQGLLEE